MNSYDLTLTAKTEGQRRARLRRSLMRTSWLLALYALVAGVGLSSTAVSIQFGGGLTAYTVGTAAPILIGIAGFWILLRSQRRLIDTALGEEPK